MSKIKSLIKVVSAFKNWYDYIIDFWLRDDGIYKYKMRDGNEISIQLRSDYRWVLNEIYVREIYTSSNFKINKEDTVLDIGAHKGIFTLYASKKAKKGQVLAFEPFKTNFLALSNHINRNNCKNVKIFNVAISGKKGTTKFNVADNELYTARHSIFLFPRIGSANVQKVDTITLKNIIEDNKLEKINFLKMDCEGTEYEVFFGTDDDTLNKIDKISMECHNLDDKRNSRVMREFLENKGFRTFIKNPLEKEASLLLAKRIY